MGGGRGNLGFAQNTSIIPQKKAIFKQHDPQVQVSQCYWGSRAVAATSALGGQESRGGDGCGAHQPTGPGSRFTIRCTQPRQLCNVLLGAGDKHIHKRSLPVDVIVFVNI